MFRSNENQAALLIPHLLGKFFVGTLGGPAHGIVEVLPVLAFTTGC